MPACGYKPKIAQERANQKNIPAFTAGKRSLGQAGFVSFWRQRRTLGKLALDFAFVRKLTSNRCGVTEVEYGREAVKRR